MRRCKIHSGLGAALLLATACHTPPGQTEVEGLDEPRLPFHVAVLHVEPEVFEGQTSGEPDEGDARIDLAGEERVDLATTLARVLEDNVFQRATALGPVGSGSELLRTARDRGADLVLHVERVSFDLVPESKAHVSNYGWFLLGPMVFAFSDRSYLMDCTAQLALYDLNALGLAEDDEFVDDDGPIRLDQDALIRRFRVQPAWVSTRYKDRVEELSLAKTIFIPTSRLAKNGPQVERYVAEESAYSMARELAKRISVEADFLTQPPRDLGRFLLEIPADPEGAEPLFRLRGTELVFEAPLRQEQSSYSAGDLHVRVRVGERWEASSSDTEPRDDRAVVEYDTEGSGPVPAGWVGGQVSASIPVKAFALDQVDGGEQVQATELLVQVVLTERKDTDQERARSWTFSAEPVRDEVVRAVEGSSPRSEPSQASEGGYPIDS